MRSILENIAEILEVNLLESSILKRIKALDKQSFYYKGEVKKSYHQAIATYRKLISCSQNSDTMMIYDTIKDFIQVFENFIKNNKNDINHLKGVNIKTRQIIKSKEDLEQKTIASYIKNIEENEKAIRTKKEDVEKKKKKIEGLKSLLNKVK